MKKAKLDDKLIMIFPNGKIKQARFNCFGKFYKIRRPFFCDCFVYYDKVKNFPDSVCVFLPYIIFYDENLDLILNSAKQNSHRYDVFSNILEKLDIRNCFDKTS